MAFSTRLEQKYGVIQAKMFDLVTGARMLGNCTCSMKLMYQVPSVGYSEERSFVRVMGWLLYYFLFSAGLFRFTLAQDQRGGYISIDCGLPAGTTYVDPATDITYMSDAEFVDGGISKSIPPHYNASNLAQQLQLVRSFPQTSRSCYHVGVKQGAEYLIRATFMYADYDGLNRVPRFDLYVGPNRWDTVVLDNATSVVYKEIVHWMAMSYIDVCLVNTSYGVPFISALEFRPLKDGPYGTNSQMSVASFMRLDFGSTSGKILRSPNDFLDRLWVSHTSNEWTTLSTTEVIDAESGYFGYGPPLDVMRTSAAPADASEPLNFSINAKDSRLQFHLYLYFAELEKLHNNQSRQFDIILNGNTWYGSCSPHYLYTVIIYSRGPLNGGGPYSFSLVRTENSTLPPVINGIEVYYVVELSQNQTDQVEVDAIKNVKLVYEIKKNWEGDPCAPQAYLWDGLSCNVDSNGVPRILSLNLRSSGLIGEISAYISNLTMLQSLDLSNNNLTGLVPDFLTQLQFLKVLNLSHNKLSGSVPSELIQRSLQSLLVLSVEGNPNLCSSLQCKKKNKHTSVFLLLVSVSVAATIAIVAILAYGIAALLPRLKRHMLGEAKISKFNKLLKLNKGSFTSSQLRSITNNFERIIGKGGFGTVYHGYLHGNQVAVKILSSSSAQGYKQFQAEVDVLLRVHHCNLVSLVGYCDESNQMGLIYEYMVNGNLEDCMADNSRAPLSWEQRLRVSLGAALGLEYLHKGCEPQIVHRDVKSSNILLNEKLDAKLADFGLSRSFPISGGSHVYTDVVGTFGYFDPEYFRSRRFTTKSDVYSFGVVLLEIITGKPAVVEAEEMTHITQWVGSVLNRGEVANIIDPKLDGEFDINSVKRVVQLAMTCVSLSLSERPTMHQVVSELTERLAMELARNKEHEVKSLDSSMSVNSIETS